MMQESVNSRNEHVVIDSQWRKMQYADCIFQGSNDMATE